MTLIFNIVAALGSIGTFITAIIALIKVLKTAAAIKFKPEKLYGKEATDRYDEMCAKPHKNAIEFGPDDYKGGTKSLPQFEVERFCFDQQTMPSEWKNLTRTVRYFYEENGRTMVHGWRL